MSGEGHLRELESILDDAQQKRRKAEQVRAEFSEAYWSGEARGTARVIALIAGTTVDHELNESSRRIQDTIT